MYLNLVGIELDLVSNLEFLRWLAVSGHLLLASSEHCFSISSCFFEPIEAFVDCGDVAVSTGGHGEVGLIAVHDLEWRMLQGRLDAAVDHKLSY